MRARQALPEEAPLWILDELHKMTGWRSWLEGACCLHHRRHSVLVTGSARLPPLGVPWIKAVKNEPKLYLWDRARVEGEAARFEILVLSHLLRLVHWLVDERGERAELRYFRTTVGHEVDAVITRKGRDAPRARDAIARESAIGIVGPARKRAGADGGLLESADLS